jgi:phosphate-selective porin OprO/OprP
MVRSGVAAILLVCVALLGSARAQSSGAPPLPLPALGGEEQPAALPGSSPGLERLPPLESRPPIVDEAVVPTAYSNASMAMQAGTEDPNRFGMLGLGFQEYIERQMNPPGFPKGKPSLVIGGQVQIDSVYFGQDEVSRQSVGDLQDAADFRRARIIAQGISHEVYRYVFGVDFALSGRPSFLDMYIEHTELNILQNVRVGHYFEPFSLERVTQNRNNTFMERSLVDTFAPARNLGVMTYGVTESERASWQIGTFRTGSNDFGNDSFDSGQALTMRATCLPYYDEASEGRYYVHLGGCYSYRDTYQNQVRFRNSPEIRIQEPDQPTNFGPIFVDTGNIPASSFQLFDAEFIWTQDSFSVQSEYACSTVDQTGGPGLFFDAFMVQASYFLTGEFRPYDRRMGINQRVIPNTNFRMCNWAKGVPMGIGAWELAARFSFIRLNDQNIDGNNLQDFTAGVNWYWNPYARCRFNYIRAYLDDIAFGKSKTDIYGMRVDFEF